MTSSGRDFPRVDPLVSVLIPVRNAGGFLIPALRSVLAQSYRNLEILLVEDGSSDGSFALIRQFRDPRIKILGDSRQLGITSRLNEGIDASSGKYLARMDADDICAPDRISLQVATMEADPSLAVLGSAVAYIDAKGMVVGAPRPGPADDMAIKRRLVTSNCIVHPSAMLRASVLREHKYSPSYPVAQDFELWLRLAAKGFKFGNLSRVLLLLRKHRDSVTATRRAQQLELASMALAAYLHSLSGVSFDASEVSKLIDPPGPPRRNHQHGRSAFEIMELAERAGPMPRDAGIEKKEVNVVRDEDKLFFALRYLIGSMRAMLLGLRSLDMKDFLLAAGIVLTRFIDVIYLLFCYQRVRKRNSQTGRELMRS